MLVTLACNLEVNALSVKKLKKVINDNSAELVPALTSGLSFILKAHAMPKIH